MTILTVFLNEQSLNFDGTSGQEFGSTFRDATNLPTILLKIDRIHPKFRLGILAGLFDQKILNKNVRSWFREWFGNDRYLWVQSRTDLIDSASFNLAEVHLNGQTAIGLTFAYLQNTWACSISRPEWHQTIVSGIKIDQELNETPCEIRHVARSQDVDHWEQSLRDWGQFIATTSQIGSINGFSINMYSAPREHGLPHIHIVDRQNQKTVAKYRVDVFVRMEGKMKELDQPIKEWVETYKDTLLKSWDRCMRGLRPYEMRD